MPKEILARLKVCANPYGAVDHKGHPAGAVLRDPVGDYRYGGRDNPNHPDPDQRFHPRSFVGSRVLARSVETQAQRAFPNGPIVQNATHHHGHEFSPDEVAVPNTDYYRRMVRTHQLFAADLETWEACGGLRATFQEPALKLAHAKEGAVAQFLACHAERGEDGELVADPNDTRLQTLALHWDEHVEARHPAALAAAAVVHAARLEAHAKTADAAKAAGEGPAKAHADETARLQALIERKPYRREEHTEAHKTFMARALAAQGVGVTDGR